MKCFGNSIIMVMSRKMSLQASRKINNIHAQYYFKQHLKNFYILCKKGLANTSDVSTNFPESRDNRRKWYLIKSKYLQSPYPIISSAHFNSNALPRKTLQNRELCPNTTRQLSNRSQFIENLDCVDYLNNKTKIIEDSSLEQIDTSSLECYYSANKLVIPNKSKRRPHSIIPFKKRKVNESKGFPKVVRQLSTVEDKKENQKNAEQPSYFRKSIAKKMNVAPKKGGLLKPYFVNETVASVKPFKNTANSDIPDLSKLRQTESKKENIVKHLKENEHKVPIETMVSENKKNVVYKSSNRNTDYSKYNESVRQFHSNSRMYSLEETRPSSAMKNQNIECVLRRSNQVQTSSKKVKEEINQGAPKVTKSKNIETAVDTNIPQTKNQFKNHKRNVSDDVSLKNDSVTSQTQPEYYNGNSKRLLNSASLLAYNIAVTDDKNNSLGTNNVTDLQNKRQKLNHQNKLDGFKNFEEKRDGKSTINNGSSKGAVQPFKSNSTKQKSVLVKDILSLYKKMKGENFRKYQVTLTCAQPKLPAAREVTLDYTGAEPVPGKKDIKRTTILELLLKKNRRAFELTRT